MQDTGGRPVVVIQADDAERSCASPDIYKRMSRGDLILQLATGDGPQEGHVIPALLRPHQRARPSPDHPDPDPDRRRAGQVRQASDGPCGCERGAVHQGAVRIHPRGRTARLQGRRHLGQSDRVHAWRFIDYRATGSISRAPSCRPTGSTACSPRCRCSGRSWAEASMEGLFAVNFRLNGQASSPSLTVNPALRGRARLPRKLFGVGAAGDL